MKILHITVTAQIGGGPEHIWRLANGLKRKGVAQCIATPDDAPYHARYASLIGEDNIVQLPHRKFTLRAFVRLARFARKKRCTIIHSHGKGAGVYGRLLSLILNIPCVHTYHGIHLPQHPLFKKAYCILEKCFGRITEYGIAVSPGEQSALVELGFIPKSRSRLIPNGVFVPAKIEARQSRQPFNVAHVSRFDPKQKNSAQVVAIAEILKESNRLDGIHFTMIGDGPERQQIEEHIRALGLASAFTFLGSLGDTRPELQKAHLALSTSRWEGLPLALLEAQSEGLPVVATKVIGNEDAILGDKTGFLYDIDAPAEAADAILRLKDDADLWNAFSQAAYHFVHESFGEQSMIDRTLSVYQEI